MPLWLQTVLAVVVGCAVYDFLDGFARSFVAYVRGHRSAQLRGRIQAEVKADPHNVRLVLDNTEGKFTPHTTTRTRWGTTTTRLNSWPWTNPPGVPPPGDVSAVTDPP
jgi:hypothetical protein